MTISTLSSRELNHDVSSAKKAAQKGPVVITDRGKPSHVLMTYGDFQRLTGKRRNLGTFASRAAAEKHEREVRFFKRH